MICRPDAPADCSATPSHARLLPTSQILNICCPRYPEGVGGCSLSRPLKTTSPELHFLVLCVTAANLVVGGANGGWDLSTDLQSWASSQTFAPGDTLTFSFGSFHSVVEVPKADYEACTVNAPIQAYTSGSAVVKLSSPGKRYFVCGTPGHCGQGMKMEIDIASASEVINAPTASPVIPTPSLSSPPPVDGLTMPPQSSPAHAPLKPSAALSPIIETSGPPVIQFPEAAGPSPQLAQGENNGGRQLETGIALVVSLLMALALP